MIRRAVRSEASAISDLALRSKAHWGYNQKQMAVFADELRVTPAALRRHETFVAEDQERLLGFYSLASFEGDQIELGHLFVEPSALRGGVGRELLHHARINTTTTGYPALWILSDPNARAFYQRQGAEFVRDVPSSIPGRTLPLLRMPLRPCRRVDRRVLAFACGCLAEADADLARILARLGPPPLWSRPSGFATLFKIILEQQVALASAKTLYARVERAMGEVSVERVLARGEAGLRNLGLTRQKASYCVALAKASDSGAIDLRRIARLNDEGAREALIKLRGIGVWSAEVYLLMALRRPDIWPRGDLALRKQLTRIKARGRGVVDETRELRIAEAWRPWRSVAARIVWNDYLNPA